MRMSLRDMRATYDCIEDALECLSAVPSGAREERPDSSHMQLTIDRLELETERWRLKLRDRERKELHKMRGSA